MENMKSLVIHVNKSTKKVTSSAIRKTVQKINERFPKKSRKLRCSSRSYFKKAQSSPRKKAALEGKGLVPKRQSKCIETYVDELKGRTTDRGVKIC